MLRQTQKSRQYLRIFGSIGAVGIKSQEREADTEVSTLQGDLSAAENERANYTTHTDALVFLRDAFQELAKCRHFLRCSYAYGYFKFQKEK